MQNHPEARSYDMFKLIVALLVIITIIFLLMSQAAAKTPAASGPTPTPEVIVMVITATAPPPEADDEVDQAALPPLPEPSAGLRYDRENEVVINQNGEIVYRLNETRTVWVPIVPKNTSDLEQVTLESEWILADDEGRIVYIWDYITLTWVIVIEKEVIGTTTYPISDCPRALAPRLTAGGRALIVTNLNYRTSPSTNDDNWIRTNPPGIRVTVLGENICTQYNYGSYRWWKIQTPGGEIGWSAEGSAVGPNYFLEPVD